MGFLFKTIAIASCLTAASVAHAVPFSYDEGVSGDIEARIGNIPRFEFGAGANVIAGSQFFSGSGFDLDGDFDIFSFVIPRNSVLRFVTVEFPAFNFTGPVVGFGPNYLIQRGAFTGNPQFVDTTRTSTSSFTDVLTSIGPLNLFTRLPLDSGSYDWIDGFGANGEFGDFSTMWDYRLTFGVDSLSVPEPGPLMLMSIGLFVLFLGSLSHSRRARVGATCRAA